MKSINERLTEGCEGFNPVTGCPGHEPPKPKPAVKLWQLANYLDHETAFCFTRVLII
jgi:hypothetical protein